MKIKITNNRKLVRNDDSIDLEVQNLVDLRKKITAFEELHSRTPNVNIDFEEFEVLNTVERDQYFNENGQPKDAFVKNTYITDDDRVRIWKKEEVSVMHITLY